MKYLIITLTFFLSKSEIEYGTCIDDERILTLENGTSLIFSCGSCKENEYLSEDNTDININYMTSHKDIEERINQFQSRFEENFELNIKEIPNKERYDFIQNGKYMISKKESTYDLVALTTFAIGLYFTFKFISNMSDGIKNVISSNKSGMTFNNPILNVICIVWPLIIFPLISFVFSKKARKIQKNRYNVYTYLGSIMELSYAFVLSIELYISLIN